MIVLPPLSETATGTTELYSTQQNVSSSGGYYTLPESCFSDNPLFLNVYANLANTRKRENDKFNFTQLINNGYYVSAYLIKDGVEYEIDDNTYGDFNDLGSISGASRYWCFILDFNKVATELSFGSYKLKKEIRLVSNGSLIQAIYSPCFNLMPYDCQLAHKTVKISAIQKGFIRSGADWTNLQGTGYEYYEVRLRGILRRTGYTTETESVIDTQDRSRQISTGTYKNWQLQLNWIGSFISDFIMENLMLANPIEVSDFNVDNIKVYDDVKLKFLNADDPKYFKGNTQELFNINLEDYQKNNIKQH